MPKQFPASGKSAGFANVTGFLAAFYLHGSLSILGISVLLVQSAQAFLMVKIIGAAYLCWIGIKALWSAWHDTEIETTLPPEKSKLSLGKAFMEGFLTNALNPKVSMFYLAAFPQFIPANGEVVSAFLLVFIHSIINLIWFSAMVILLSRFITAIKGGPVQRGIKALTGFVFVGFGLKLASLKA